MQCALSYASLIDFLFRVSLRDKIVKTLHFSGVILFYRYSYIEVSKCTVLDTKTLM